MLEQIIKTQCKSLDDNREKLLQNEQIKKIEIRIDNVLGALKEIDQDLCNEIDSLFGEITLAYGHMYFKNGFKDGIKLVEEINKQTI